MDNRPEGPPPPGRLFVASAGFFAPRLRRILTLAGWRPVLGRPGPEDWVGVWGRSPVAARGEALAARTGARLLRVEDAFLRSIRTGREGEPPLGLMLDPHGVHFDCAGPSRLERLLARHPLDDTALLDRARAAIDRMRRGHLSKYNAGDPSADVPEPGYVLVVDQTAGDASIRHGGATPATFQEMLTEARLAHPGARILVRTHPETLAGRRPGHFAELPAGVAFDASLATPWAVLEGAVAVYTVSSQLGFEAILAGHRPHVFGGPWYAGWGLTEDRADLPRRGRRLTRAQLVAAAMILAPTWYDPCRGRLCSLEEALDHLEARVRAYREDRRGWVAYGMRGWKRGPVQRFFGAERRVVFRNDPRAVRPGTPVLAWAGRVSEDLERATAAAKVPLWRCEDGFLRSRGLGAALVPPVSLVADDLGIYYDPAVASRLERLIAEAEALPAHALARAARLRAALVRMGLTKYNQGGAVPALPVGRRVLVPGQVEDDASILRGCGAVRTNLGLLEAARAANPDALILWKPHPDVEAGLRRGAVPAADLERLADAVLAGADPAALLAEVHEVWTLTSAMGFEALLRGLPVTCLGAPFYAGWGLTRDLGPVPARREARPSLDALVHAALIAYPRYRDPVSGLPCPPEVAVERLAAGVSPRGPVNRGLAKAQGWLAGLGLWR